MCIGIFFFGGGEILAVNFKWNKQKQLFSNILLKYLDMYTIIKQSHMMHINS